MRTGAPQGPMLACSVRTTPLAWQTRCVECAGLHSRLGRCCPCRTTKSFHHRYYVLVACGVLFFCIMFWLPVCRVFFWGYYVLVACGVPFFLSSRPVVGRHSSAFNRSLVGACSRVIPPVFSCKRHWSECVQVQTSCRAPSCTRRWTRPWALHGGTDWPSLTRSPWPRRPSGRCIGACFRMDGMWRSRCSIPVWLAASRAMSTTCCGWCG